MSRLLGLVALLILAGCSGLPCHRTGQPLVRDPAGVVSHVAAVTPETFSGFNSIVFEIVGQKFLGIGFVDIDRGKGTFRVICLNPMGVKLFDLSGDERSTTTNFALEPLAKAGDIAGAVGSDIRRIYFDAVPRSNATPRWVGGDLVYGGGVPGGYLEHIYGGTSGELIEKRFYGEQLISWQVTYHDYREKDGKRIPGTIVLTSYQGGYRLTIREKEQTVDEDKNAD